MIREAIKWCLFPGVNLHARLRYRLLSRFLRTADPAKPGLVLDAGCGNGMLAYQSFLRGNRVLGITVIESEIARNRRFFHEFLGVPEDRLSFQLHDVRDVASLGIQFDEIICSEVLIYIRDDRQLCYEFWRCLRPGGALHLCSPNGDHPFHRKLARQGRTLRAGYTKESYRALLEPIGFHLSDFLGLGGGLRHLANQVILGVQRRFGVAAATSAFLLFSPLVALEARSHKLPFSVYVRATKPGLAPSDLPSGS